MSKLMEKVAAELQVRRCLETGEGLLTDALRYKLAAATQVVQTDVEVARKHPITAADKSSRDGEGMESISGPCMDGGRGMQTGQTIVTDGAQAVSVEEDGDESIYTNPRDKAASASAVAHQSARIMHQQHASGTGGFKQRMMRRLESMLREKQTIRPKAKPARMPPPPKELMERHPFRNGTEKPKPARMPPPPPMDLMGPQMRPKAKPARMPPPPPMELMRPKKASDTREGIRNFILQSIRG